jgi:hypothetical protein
MQGQLHESQKEKQKGRRKKKAQKAGLKVAWPGGQQWGDLQENNSSQSIADCASGGHVMDLFELITIGNIHKTAVSQYKLKTMMP